MAGGLALTSRPASRLVPPPACGAWRLHRGGRWPSQHEVGKQWRSRRLNNESKKHGIDDAGLEGGLPADGERLVRRGTAATARARDTRRSGDPPGIPVG
jgi:hypothetical protein